MLPWCCVLQRASVNFAEVWGPWRNSTASQSSKRIFGGWLIREDPAQKGEHTELSGQHGQVRVLRRQNRRSCQ
jgi:hypothetical protein